MEVISHKGIVVASDPYVTRVEIIRESACSACHAKGLCGYSESEKKIVDVATDPLALHNVGDEVELCMKRTMGMKAVWISYVIPLVIMMAVILALSLAEVEELATGLAAIAAVALYYLVILMMRSRLSNEFIFYIK